ncbi:hypothetical protein C2845_PM05G08490 [Panicum miliaceum]|uniref:Uncharacterized protein n=1 Tax=Panicum miliaceum TaxID=4540 RepID=A0A3L6T1G9_PANMI|nr:hypothetical protein C2845_PM05G08490 [Panicum miliaceum]
MEDLQLQPGGGGGGKDRISDLPDEDDLCDAIRSFAEEIVRLPVNNFSALKLELRTDEGHAFGTTVLQLLKTLNTVLHYTLSNSSEERLQDNGGAAAASWWFLVAAVALFYHLVMEQLSYRRKKGPLPGPPLVVPFFGSIAQVISDPTAYWDGLAARAKASPLGLSADYFLGRFVVFIRDTELTHRVLANVRPDAFHFIGHPFGKKLFGDHNLIYMFGDDHRELHRRIAPNFTPRALSTYAAIQQRVIVAHIRRWLDAGSAANKPFPLRVPCRDMNLETSQTVFVGPYLAAEAREKFARDYNLFNVGFMTMPVDLPGFAFRLLDLIKK